MRVRPVRRPGQSGAAAHRPRHGPGLAAWALGLGGTGQVAGWLRYARLADWLGTRGRTVAIIAAVAATTLLFGLLPGPAALLVAASVLAGAVCGVFTLTEATLVTDHWGTRPLRRRQRRVQRAAHRRRGDCSQHRRGAGRSRAAARPAGAGR